MQRVLAVVVVVALLGGCQTYAQSRTTAKVGGVMTLLGIASVGLAIGLGAGNGNPAHDRPLALGVLGFVFVLVPGSMLGVGGVTGMAIYDKPQPVQGQ